MEIETLKFKTSNDQQSKDLLNLLLKPIWSYELYVWDSAQAGPISCRLQIFQSRILRPMILIILIR